MHLNGNDLCAFTIVQNETYFLDIWVNYYSRSIPFSDLYVLNHNSYTDAALSVLDKVRSLGVNVINVHNKFSFNHYWLRSVVEKFHRFLLNSYKVVIFAESDEIIIPRPDLYSANLKEYVLNNIDGSKDNIIRCVGYCLEHDPAIEPALDLSKPVMSQRRKWRYTQLYNKPAISSRECSWNLGFHCLLNDINHPVDKHLLLIHLHKMDYHLCKQRHKERAFENWAKHEEGYNENNQNRFYDGKEFDDFFFSGQFTTAKVEQIPDFMIGAF